MRPWARFKRFCHLLLHGPGLFRGDVHRAVTYREFVGRFEPRGSSDWELVRAPVNIECDCGRAW